MYQAIHNSLSGERERERGMDALNSTKPDDHQILVEEKLSARILTLNRPKQLNALLFQMISRLLELFIAYEEDSNVKLVIVKGKGRAFCAGGDVAAVNRDINEGTWRLGAKFVWMQYTLNYILATNRKPQVFAMPEIALGLFPDVGASYFVSRLPGFFGEYLGLTGTRLDGAEMLVCGLATHFVPSERLSLLEEALCKVDSSDPAIISAVINEYSKQPYMKEKSAYRRLNVIDRCFSQRTVEEIISALEREALNKKDDWISETIQSLKRASPTSLKISLRSIREGRLQGVGQCLIREFRIACHAMQGKLSKDFFEGIRAILLDKDKNPKWEPSKLELVSDDMVDSYFSMMDDEGWEDLKLPARSNLPAYAIAKL
ncbi:3-hydroxyisobutyryl-CoA hydrolase 1-like isoform X2 [Castanea sativa]|uniref:3-hydroxyisobutyryl-CoA hydrolase 1-like isoform X2 n=1 Tax=Castanea sativa TaxID=21020 RepID=UPI003F64C2DC